MSLIALAEAIDCFVDNRQAFIAESESSAIVSDLSVAHANTLLGLCASLDWKTQLFDRADELWGGGALEVDFQPFRLVIEKPATVEGTLRLLTNRAFSQSLLVGHSASNWQVARLQFTVVTRTRAISPWGEKQSAMMSATTKSPRSLVKEFGSERKVPEDVRPWLAAETHPEYFNHPTTQVWVSASSVALISCLPDEIDAENGVLRFRGPPRLALPKFDNTTEPLDFSTYSTLQAVVGWVFENEREAEMRHILLGAELARSGASPQSTRMFLTQNLVHAWESAKIAYQMALAETGRDTLKVLSDLRKAVTEETSKLSDMGRQLTASVAASVATGISLIAARVMTNAPPLLITLVMGVVALYVATVITSGMQFMSLQRQLREDWQQRLYRFLPTKDYERMVIKPTQKAERAFAWTARLGGITVMLLTVVCIFLAFMPEGSAPTSSQINTTPSVIIQRSSEGSVKTTKEPLRDEVPAMSQGNNPGMGKPASTVVSPNANAPDPAPHTFQNTGVPSDSAISKGAAD